MNDRWLQNLWSNCEIIGRNNSKILNLNIFNKERICQISAGGFVGNPMKKIVISSHKLYL